MLSIISVNPVVIAKLPVQPGLVCRLGVLLLQTEAARRDTGIQALETQQGTACLWI